MPWPANKPNDLSSSWIKSSTTPRIKNSTHANKSSGIKERVSILSSNTKVQCYRLNSIHSRGNNLSSIITAYDLNSASSKKINR